MKQITPTLTPKEKKRLLQKTKKLRRDILRMISGAGSGHPGGSLSCIDLLTVLFYKYMIPPTRGRSSNTKFNLFVLSKGHAAPALYAVLADQKIIDRGLLKTLRKLGSPLQGHPDSRFLPSAGPCTGSLGQGISVAVGMALAAKLKQQSLRIFSLLGDGEINEGQVWEASLAAAHHQLDNLTAIVDCNGFQQTGACSEILDTSQLAKKWQAFNWTTLSINGHNIDQIHWALEPDRIIPQKPTIIIANTIKGKGISFMESSVEFHGKAPSKKELRQALAELK